MNVLVTGGCGFIGSNLVRHLRSERPDWTIVNLDLLTYAGNLENLRDLEKDDRHVVVRGDIGNRELVDHLLAQHGIEAVLHLAAESHVDRSILGPELFVRTNVLGTQVLLEACHRRKVRRFVMVSTDEVYGSLGPSGAFTETSPIQPSSPYSASKAAADLLALAFHHTFRMDVVVTRCSNNYGPYQFPEKLIPLMILNALEGKALPIYGDGGNVRDWLYVEDHCRGILAVLAQGRPGEKYNLGGRSERTNLAIVDAICDALEAERPAAGNPALAARGIAQYRDLKTSVPDRPGHDRRYAIDDKKIRAELGWAPRHDFAAGLKATVRWYLDHLSWCAGVQSGRYRRERLGLLEPTPR